MTPAATTVTLRITDRFQPASCPDPELIVKVLQDVLPLHSVELAVGTIARREEAPRGLL